MTDYVTLNNGVKMPMEGFGVFQMDPEVTEEAVYEALQTGYRLIDNASAYKNEKEVAKAIARSGLKREDLFLTSKAYINEMGYEKTMEAFERSCKNLNTDYLDLYLIHQPFGDYYGSWRAMTELYKAGRIRAIGVSNFLPDRLLDLCFNTDIIPAVNQIELHPFYQRQDELDLMKESGIHAQAWAPFAEGRNGLFTNPVLKEIADRHHKTVGQVVLRWNIDRGISINAKSVHRNSVEENMNIWDFQLTDENMEAIRKLDLGHPQILDTRKVSEVKRVYDFLENPVVTSL